MAREYNLKPAVIDGAVSNDAESSYINRRQFLRYGFNTATGVLAASLGVLGFASILLPPGGTNAGDLGSCIGPKAVKTKHGMAQSTCN